MGIERHLFKVFLVTSELLGRSWVVKAQSVDDATGKIVVHCKEALSRLEQLSASGDINLDLRFTELENDVLEF